MASTALQQIYESKRKGKVGRNQEESEEDHWNVSKAESNNSSPIKPASVKPASVKAKSITRSRNETDKPTSSGMYPKQVKRNAKIKDKWGMLSPYLDRSDLRSFLVEPLTIHYEYKTRLTANKIVEPHISYKMDHMVPDLLSEQLKNWNKRDKMHTDKHISFSSGTRITTSCLH
ncbi:uncharacterized protein [Narcine bancroftii]|uniref:uncharacterized protein isoform X3 n=1 Tax=Narcine bancroftii TaxID=1343680 RepID=UPI003831E0FA